MLIQLIKKDFLLNWKYILLMAALCCIYPAFLFQKLADTVSYAGLLGFILMSFFVVLFSLLQTFQKESMYPKVSTWLCALPYSRRELVLAKYIFFLTMYAVCCLIYWLQTLVVPELGHFGFSEVISVFSGLALLLGIYLPFQYRFGYDFTKYFFIFSILGISFVLPLFIRYLPPEFLTFEPDQGTLVLLLLFSSALLAASVAASIYFYNKASLT